MNCSLLRYGSLLFLVAFMATLAHGQAGIKFKLQLIEENKWGVYARPEGVTPSTNQTIVGSGQVTVVMPIGYAWNTLSSQNGVWLSTPAVNGPMENPTRRYQTFGFSSEVVPIPWQAGTETLLFTFKGNGICPDSIYLMDNETDPYNQLPNSVGNNPGNEITVFDIVIGDVYEYAGNYSRSAWSCNDCDGDGILNAFEDTDGDGTWNPFNEDINGNGLIDFDEDLNNNGFLNPGEDYDGDGLLDLVNEDVDGDGYLDPDASPVCLRPCASFSVDPTDATVCTGSDTTFFATASIPQGHFDFGWEYSDDFGASWTSIDFVSMAAIYSHAQTGSVSSGTDILTIHNVAFQYGRRFRAVANSTDCGTVYSKHATMTVHGPLSVTDQPDPVTECFGYSTTFTATISNPAPAGSTIVQWQISLDSGATWFNLPNSSTYAGATSISNTTGVTILLISNVAVPGHGALFRVSYRTSTCPIQYSAAAMLNVEGPITVTEQPVDVDLCAGAPASFFSTANVGTIGTLTYQWQVTSDNGINWNDINSLTDGGVYTGFNTTTLNISNTTGLYSRRYRLAFSTGECNRVYSQQANLNMDGPLSFIAHPQDVIQCSGDAVLFGAVAKSGSLEADSLTQIQYTWQESVDGGITWVDLNNDTLYNGVNTDTISISFTTGLYGNAYRLKIWTYNCDTVFTNPAFIDVESPITVTNEPDNITQCAGFGAAFSATVALSNGNPATMQYQWEESAWIPTNPLFPAGAGTYGTWTALSNTAPYSGVTTNMLTISDVAGKYKNRYRMRFNTPYCDFAWTNYAQLTVEGPITVTNHPDHKTICSGSATSFGIQMSNPGQGNVTYQWQICMSGDSLAGPWVNLPTNIIYNGATTANLSVSNVDDKDGFYFRCRIQTSECNPIVSYAAVLRVEGPISIASHPVNQNACLGETASFTATATTGGGGLLYQWQVSSDGTSYTDLQDGGTNELEGTDSPTLSIGNNSGLNGKMFRLAATTLACSNINVQYAQPATLTTFDCNEKCLKLKLQLQPDSTSWAVVARPSGNYDPTENAMTTAGRVTVVVPADFNLIGANNIAGEWSPVLVTENVAGQPGKKFITFQLTTPPGGVGVHIPYSIHHETPLFSFNHAGPCPAFLYLLEVVPTGLQHNLLSGTDLVGNVASVDFEFCSVYARKAWRCKNPGTGPGGPIIVVTEDHFETDEPGKVTARENSVDKPEENWFTAAPNPAGDYVNITLSESLAEGQPKLYLFDLQGKKRMEATVIETVTRLELGGLPAGVYFVSLAQNGRVLQREKVIIQ